MSKFFWVPPISSGTDKATNFKFGRYIHGVHPNKSPLKFWEKMERGRIQGYALSKFFWVPPIIPGTGKATNFNFCTHILSIDRNKSQLQISGKVAGCVVRTLKTFQGTHILLSCSEMRRISLDLIKNVERFAWTDLDRSRFEKERNPVSLSFCFVSRSRSPVYIL